MTQRNKAYQPMTLQTTLLSRISTLLVLVFSWHFVDNKKNHQKENITTSAIFKIMNVIEIITVAEKHLYITGFSDVNSLSIDVRYCVMLIQKSFRLPGKYILGMMILCIFNFLNLSFTTFWVIYASFPFLF